MKLEILVLEFYSFHRQNLRNLLTTTTTMQSQDLESTRKSQFIEKHTDPSSLFNGFEIANSVAQNNTAISMIHEYLNSYRVEGDDVFWGSDIVWEVITEMNNLTDAPKYIKDKLCGGNGKDVLEDIYNKIVEALNEVIEVDLYDVVPQEFYSFLIPFTEMRIWDPEELRKILKDQPQMINYIDGDLLDWSDTDYIDLEEIAIMRGYFGSSRLTTERICEYLYLLYNSKGSSYDKERGYRTIRKDKRTKEVKERAVRCCHVDIGIDEWDDEMIKQALDIHDLMNQQQPRDKETRTGKELRHDIDKILGDKINQYIKEYPALIVYYHTVEARHSLVNLNPDCLYYTEVDSFDEDVFTDEEYKIIIRHEPSFINKLPFSREQYNTEIRAFLRANLIHLDITPDIIKKEIRQELLATVTTWDRTTFLQLIVSSGIPYKQLERKLTSGNIPSLAVDRIQLPVVSYMKGFVLVYMKSYLSALVDLYSHEELMEFAMMGVLILGSKQTIKMVGRAVSVDPLEINNVTTFTPEIANHLLIHPSIHNYISMDTNMRLPLGVIVRGRELVMFGCKKNGVVTEGFPNNIINSNMSMAEMREAWKIYKGEVEKYLLFLSNPTKNQITLGVMANMDQFEYYEDELTKSQLMWIYMSNPTDVKYSNFTQFTKARIERKAASMFLTIHREVKREKRLSRSSKSSTKPVESDECPVCCVVTTTTRLNGCKHFICQDCWVTWRRKSAEGNCPTCRQHPVAREVNGMVYGENKRRDFGVTDQSDHLEDNMMLEMVFV